MSKINFITLQGDQQEVDVENGYSIMEGAIDNDIEGIEADCGGACACTTCHCYIDEDWLDKLPPMNRFEDELLDDLMSDRKDNSRLTCELEMTDELDGIVVYVYNNM